MFLFVQGCGTFRLIPAKQASSAVLTAPPPSLMMGAAYIPHNRGADN